MKSPIFRPALITAGAWLSFAAFASGMAAEAPIEIPLSGEWRFQPDPDDKGGKDRWFMAALPDRIRLPGTTEAQRKGPPDSTVELQHLSRTYPYVGAAWYQRDIEIPVSWQGKRVTLELERTKTTAVWLGGRAIGVRDSLTTTQVHDLGGIAPGRNVLTIRVDNLNNPPVGDPHQISDQTQTNWNGIIGRIALKATDPVWLDEVRVRPDVARKQARVRVVFGGGKPLAGTLRVTACSWNTPQNHTPPPSSFQVATRADGVFEFDYDLGSGMQVWDEFSPALYKLTLEFSGSVAGRPLRDRREAGFGMREFTTSGTRFAINGRPTFLRGKNDACVFPLTGHPPMDVDGWLRVLRIAKSYGINYYRFHTWCPPEAAFTAADIAGIYMQPELPVWGPIGAPAQVDRNDVEQKSDAAPIEARTRYLTEEGKRILRQFGNHPSFVMFALGNEMSGSREVMAEMVSQLRAFDGNGRLFAQGSNNFLNSPKLAAGDDFWTTFMTGGDYNTGVFQPNTRGKLVRGSFAVHTTGHINNRPPSTRGDFREALTAVPVPVIGHETGQFQVFPDFKEIDKYTGVVRARNFEEFRRRLARAGMLDQAEDFVRASGALAVICYREDIEAALRTPGFGGFHLLDLQDFPGQGTALVGILDAFMDSKGLVTPEEWREFCCETVPLLGFDRRTWTRGMTFEADAQVAHHGPRPFPAMAAQWTLADAAGKTLAEGTLPPVDIPSGGITALGRITIPLTEIPAPQQLTLTLALPGTPCRNRYPLWIYPSKPEPTAPEGVFVTSRLDDEARATLAAGGRVVLLPDPATLPQDKSVEGAFITDFWCYPMFSKYKPPGTLGILLDPGHPAFAKFPTSFHADWQWWHLTKHSRPMILDGLPRKLRPLVQVIDTFDRNHKLGLLWEAQVGPGKLLVCSSDLNGCKDEPEVRQFRQSLLDYAASPAFAPAVAVDLTGIEDLLPK